jgi:hypothetical protein
VSLLGAHPRGGLVPILFFEPPYGRRCRILDLEPVWRPAGAVRRAKPLRHDTLATERAGMLEDRCTLTVESLVECNAVMRQPQQPSQPALAILDRLAS